MTIAFTLDLYRPQIVEISVSVFRTMTGLDVRPLDHPPGEIPGDFTAAVYYAGAWQGALLVESSAAQALDWSARLMSLAPPVSLDDARDGLGELANMIAGNLKPVLPSGVGLSIPSVVQGADYSLRLCGGNRSVSLDFQDGLGPFRITLVEVVPS